MLSGIALGLSFPPYPTGALAWGALVPLLLHWTRAQSARQMGVEAFASWGVACAVAFHWVLLHPIPAAAAASLGGLLLLPLLLAFPFALSIPFRRRWGLGVGFGALVAFALTVEWALGRGPLAFPWPLLGHTQATLDPFRQLAALSGPSALSGWLWLLNGSLLAALVAVHRRTRIAALLTALLLTGSAAGYGWNQLRAPLTADNSTKTLLVQPALSASDWATLDDAARVDTLLRQSTAALDTTQPVELVIWPETALPPLADPDAHRALLDRLRQWTQRHDVSLLTGAIEPAAPLPGGARTFYNTALLVQADTAQRYRKNYLVPFAEHVPLSEHIPALQALGVPAGGVAGYARGTAQPVLQTRSFRVGALICFESAFSHHVRRYTTSSADAPPADFLVTVAQDGWWGPSLGYRQHFAFSQLHAIAVRRTMAFVTVSGRTGVISARGRPRATTRWMKRTTRIVTLPHVAARSRYVQYGDTVSHLALFLALAFGLVGLFEYARSKNGIFFS